MVAILVNGVDVTCRATDGTTVTVGRTSVRETGEASYAALTLRIGERDQIVEPFDTVEITTQGYGRFIGTVTETGLTHDDVGRAFQKINAAGPLSSWGTADVGAPPWPVETVAQRADRIAAIVGTPISVQGGTTQQVVALDVDKQRGNRLLTELAATTGGWVFDYHGGIVLQALDARKVTVSAPIWETEPPTAIWTDLAADVTWDSETANPYLPLTLPGCYVRRTPSWVATHEIGNRVRVEYGDTDPQPYVTADDSDSQTQYGVAEIGIRTTLAEQADAQELAALALQRNAIPRPAFGSVTVDNSQTPPHIWTRILEALPGARFTITDLPQPAPLTAFLGCVEGWTETYRTGGGHVIQLYLSDVRHSLAVPTWTQLDPAAVWTDEPQYADWESETV